MRTEELAEDITVAGISLRTSNEVAMRTIPAHWEAFFAKGGTSQIPGRLSEDVLAVYTRFENEGVDNTGDYTLVIGCRVEAGEQTSDGLAIVTVPASPRVVFPVEPGRPDLVPAAWQEIWAHTELPKSFVADYEHYACNGDIEISIGVISAQ